MELFVRFRGARRCAVCVDESAIVSVRLTNTVGVPAISMGKEVALPVCIVSEAQRTPELRPVRAAVVCTLDSFISSSVFCYMSTRGTKKKCSP